ncbi:MAG: kelch repeat-containing protein [Bacteroidota bacterium]
MNSFLKIKDKPLFVSSLLIFVLSCGNDDNSLNPQQKNNPPIAFELLSVANSSTAIDVIPEFTWEEALDVDGDQVLYDIFLDTDPNPSIVLSRDLSTNSFQIVQRLSLYERYYWKVIARDGNGGITESETFSFETRGLNLGMEPFLDNPPFPSRTNHTTTVLNEKIWIIGGFNSEVNRDIRELWSSDDGLSWSTVSIPVEFNPRGEHQTISFNDKLFIIGGGFREGNASPNLFNDVWSSDFSGFNWSLESATSDFSPRMEHSVVEFEEKLFVIGGDIGGGLENDVWVSENGSDWTRLSPRLIFSKRANHSTIIFQDKIWVIGGREGGFLSGRNDVWNSDDGINWNLITSSADFSGRYAHSVVVYDNKMWLFGGRGRGAEGFLNDIWYSRDGENWNLVTDDGFYSKRTGFSTIVFKDKIWLIGGEDDTSSKSDIWVFD